jgi:hypothetical protein
MRLVASPAVADDDLPTLGDILPDDCGYVAYDDDGVPYYGVTRREVRREYEECLHRLMQTAKYSGYSLAELRQHRRIELFAQETREAGRM